MQLSRLEKQEKTSRGGLEQALFIQRRRISHWTYPMDPGRWRSPAKHRAKKDVSSKAIGFISTGWLSRITTRTIDSQTRLVASRLDVLRLSSGLSCVYPGPSGGFCDGVAPACLARDRVSASFRRHASRFDRPTRSSVADCLCRPPVRCKSSDFEQFLFSFAQRSCKGRPGAVSLPWQGAFQGFRVSYPERTGDDCECLTH